MEVEAHGGRRSPDRSRLTSETFDVAILGGGPAGATLAALLASKGVSVLLADRDRFPRDKVCGEFLSWDAIPILERLGAGWLLDEAGAPPIDRCRIVARGTTLEFPLPGRARGISRLRLDSALLERARTEGARVLDGWAAEDVGRSGDGFSVTLTGPEARVEIGARAVAGSWGRWGRLDLRLGRRFAAHRDRYIGFKRHYGAAASEPGVTELHAFPGGYLGAQPIEDGRSNVCGLVHQREIAGLRGGWPAFVERLAAGDARLARIFAAEPAQDAFLSSEPVIFRAKEPVHGGILLVGDAAGLTDPLTGNGMAMAMQSAALAVPHLLAILGGRDAAAALRAYAAAHRALFAGRLRWSRRVAAAMRSPRLLSAALPWSRLAAPALARATRAAAGDVARLLAAL